MGNAQVQIVHRTLPPEVNLDDPATLTNIARKSLETSGKMAQNGHFIVWEKTVRTGPHSVACKIRGPLEDVLHHSSEAGFPVDKVDTNGSLPEGPVCLSPESALEAA